MRRAVVWAVLLVSCAVSFYWYGDTRASERTIGFDAVATIRAVFVTLFVPVPVLVAAAGVLLVGLHVALSMQREVFVRCLHCGYSSREVPRVNCPECGRTRREAEQEHRASTRRSCREVAMAAVVGLLVGSIASETWLLKDDRAWQQETMGMGPTPGIRPRAAPFEHRVVGVPAPFPVGVKSVYGGRPESAPVVRPLALDDAPPDPQVAGPDRSPQSGGGR